MKLWAKGCPKNYNQHYVLMQAELYAMANKFEPALKCYEKSIQLAIQYKFKYVEAIAFERAAALCSKNQFIKQTQIYLFEAWDAYYAWGAANKCSQLEKAYPVLLRNKPYQGTEQLGVDAKITYSFSKVALDLASVLKASQSIASQVKYDDLLKKLMQITIENAGAERGCLLLYKDNQLCLEAQGFTGIEGIKILPSIPLEETNLVPKSILNYCWHSEEIVVVNDALKEELFSADPYVQENKIVSMMCIPIATQGRVNGLLYLENNLLKGVFNSSRIELLQMLSGQIGISIENAILYENLEDKVSARTKEIEKAYTELKAAQAQLIQSEKMASLGELTAGIAHEIQNPLNFVNNFSEVSIELLEEMKSELVNGNRNEAFVVADEVKQNLQKINHHGQRADAIVKGMLQHSRSSSGFKEPTDINALVDEYLRLTYQGLRAKDKFFNATLQTDFDETIGRINLVPQEIGRVILNLLTNAFYAVNEKKEMVSNGYMPVVSLSTKKIGNKVEIRIRDNGVGIPKKVLEKIFQPFFTTKPTGEGTGLGLSLSYDVITKGHGGELKVESKEGEGAEFIIHLLTT